MDLTVCFLILVFAMSVTAGNAPSSTKKTETTPPTRRERLNSFRKTESPSYEDTFRERRCSDSLPAAAASAVKKVDGKIKSRTRAMPIPIIKGGNQSMQNYSPPLRPREHKRMSHSY